MSSSQIGTFKIPKPEVYDFTPLLPLKTSFPEALDRLDDSLSEYDEKKSANNIPYRALSSIGPEDYYCRMAGILGNMVVFLKGCVETLAEGFDDIDDHAQLTVMCKNMGTRIDKFNLWHSRLIAISTLQNLDPNKPEDALGIQVINDFKAAAEQVAAFEKIINTINGTVPDAKLNNGNGP